GSLGELAHARGQLELAEARREQPIGQLTREAVPGCIRRLLDALRNHDGGRELACQRERVEPAIVPLPLTLFLVHPSLLERPGGADRRPSDARSAPRSSSSFRLLTRLRHDGTPTCPRSARGVPPAGGYAVGRHRRAPARLTRTSEPAPTIANDT